MFSRKLFPFFFGKFNKLTESTILPYILAKYITAADMHSLGLVCKRFATMGRSNTFWQSLLLRKNVNISDETKARVKDWKDYYLTWLGSKGRVSLQKIYSQEYLQSLHGLKDPIKMIMLGNTGVGKSALVCQYVCGKFVERYDPTIEDSFKKEFQIEKSKLMFEILDTSRMERFEPLYKREWYSYNVVIYVYSVVDPNSLIDVWAEYDSNEKGRNPVDQRPIILVGTKTDLPRTVTKSQGHDMAKKMNAVYFETSAKINSNVKKNVFRSSMVACFMVTQS